MLAEGLGNFHTWSVAHTADMTIHLDTAAEVYSYMHTNLASPGMQAVQHHAHVYMHMNSTE